MAQNIFDIPIISDTIAYMLDGDEMGLKSMMSLTQNKDAQKSIISYSTPIIMKHLVKYNIISYLNDIELADVNDDKINICIHMCAYIWHVWYDVYLLDKKFLHSILVCIHKLLCWDVETDDDISLKAELHSWYSTYTDNYFNCEHTFYHEKYGWIEPENVEWYEDQEKFGVFYRYINGWAVEEYYDENISITDSWDDESAMFCMSDEI
jgi:hypothetical protein